ncbi:MAG TPA: glycine oxidase ThiO [Rhizomicrobium sp.]|nr:glycine oxidase ThiO [Rhizomicrobium sp.]
MKVVVIGAGVAGLSIGWRLRQAGVDVTVLERAQAGHGATWAAAGMLAATAEHGEKQSPEGELAYRALVQWPDFAREIEDASGMKIGYAQSGSLMVAMNAGQADGYAARAGADPDLQVLSADDARAMEPLLSHDVAGALWAAREAQVDNRALGQALARAFVRAAGILVLNEPVMRVEARDGRAVGVLTSTKFYEADAFVLAAGAWSGLIGGLPPEVIPAVKPMKGEMLSLVPPEGTPLPTHVVWGNDVYLVPRGGRLLVGATLEDVGFDTGLTKGAEDWLSDQAVSLMPSLKDWKIAEHWAGLRPGSPDGLPLLGPTAVNGLFVASGQYRNGILFAPVVAEMLSGLVLERTIDFAAFDPRRFHGSLV